MRSEALEEARQRAAEGDRRVGRAIETLEAELTSAALPRIEAARERLARDELLLAFGPAQGDKAASRAVEIAQRGSREAVSVLLTTSYGRTLLESRGVPKPDSSLSAARRVAASMAAERGTTAREILAGKALERLGKIGAAKGAAGAYVLHLTRPGR